MRKERTGVAAASLFLRRKYWRLTLRVAVSAPCLKDIGAFLGAHSKHEQ